MDIVQLVLSKLENRVENLERSLVNTQMELTAVVTLLDREYPKVLGEIRMGIITAEVLSAGLRKVYADNSAAKEAPFEGATIFS